MTDQHPMGNSPRYQPLPPLDAAEYAALKADIARNGQVYPVITDELGEVLDGHHRLRVCQELGIQPHFERLAGLSDEQKHETALRLNLQRRHLSREQKRELIRFELARNPRRSDRQIAELCGVDHKTVGVYRQEVPVAPSAPLAGPDVDQPPPTKYQANVLAAARLLREIHDSYLDLAQFVAASLEETDDVEQTVAMLGETLHMRGYWPGWLESLEEMISGPNSELGQTYLRLLPYKRNLVGDS